MLQPMEVIGYVICPCFNYGRLIPYLFSSNSWNNRDIDGKCISYVIGLNIYELNTRFTAHHIYKEGLLSFNCALSAGIDFNVTFNFDLQSKSLQMCPYV